MSKIRKVHGDETGIFAWQWYYFEYVGDSEILKLKNGYLHSKIHCLTLSLLSTAVLGTIFFCVCLKSKKHRNYLSSSFFLHYFSGIKGNLKQKKIARTIKKLLQFSFCCDKRAFFWSFPKGNSPKTNLINKATCLFANH